MHLDWKKVALACGAALLLYFGGRALLRALASDETKIRRRVESMVEGFNETRLGAVLDGLAPQFVDETSGVTRAELREVLMISFLQDHDALDHQYIYTAQLAPEEFVIEVAPGESGEPARATVSLHCVLRTKHGIYWDARIAGELRDGDDGWQWVRTTSVNHSARLRRR